MQLIGRYLSPFTRRVATTLYLYDMEFEHRPLSTMGDDRPSIRTHNPITRVPALVLDDGEVLVDSAAILDLTMSIPTPRPETSVTFSAVLNPGCQMYSIASCRDKRSAAWTDNRLRSTNRARIF